ncbi:MAG: glycosyltransferase family 39 protein [Phototrophicaceae bacterium]
MTPRWLWRTMLGVILVGYGVVAVLYAVITPVWQAPDEPAHYNYVASLVENGCCPVIAAGDWDSAALNQLTSNKFPPELNSLIPRIEYEDHQPPLYYALATLPYVLANGELVAVRLFSVLLGAGIVFLAYAIGRMIAPARPTVALTAAALMAYVPQHVGMLGTANNDALAWLLAALALYGIGRYLTALKIRHRWRWWLGFGVLLGGMFLTKTTVYFYAAVIALALVARPLMNASTSTEARGLNVALNVVSALRNTIPQSVQAKIPTHRLGRNFLRTALDLYGPRLRRAGREILIGIGVVWGVGLVLGLLWWGRNLVVYGAPDFMGLIAHDAVVVGQGRTSEFIARDGLWQTLQNGTRTLFNSFWGQLGWMGLPLPTWAYRWISVGVWVSIAGWILSLWRGRKAAPSALTVSYSVLMGVVALLAVLQVIYYNLTFYQVQGRYLFPALIPFALWLAAGLDMWPRALEQRFSNGTGNRSRWVVYVGYAVPLAVAAALGALNLWMLRYAIPSLAP